jgi:hypothetical protein
MRSTADEFIIRAKHVNAEEIIIGAVFGAFTSGGISNCPPGIGKDEGEPSLFDSYATFFRIACSAAGGSGDKSRHEKKTKMFHIE